MSTTVLAWLAAVACCLVLLSIATLAWMVLRRPCVPYKARERERAREHARKCLRAFLTALWEVARS